jgi:hypothetical protein
LVLPLEESAMRLGYHCRHESGPPFWQIPFIIFGMAAGIAIAVTLLTKLMELCARWLGAA